MKKFVVSLVMVCLIVSSVFAVTFSDISGHWAEGYITEIAGGGIVAGYSDGTFRPNRKVTKCESVLMMYRMYDTQGLVDKDQEETLKNRFAGVMDENDIPKWEGLREAIAYFLEYNIIPEEDLEDFLRGTKHVNMTRERVSYYLAKSLNMHLKEEIGGVIESVFNDMGDINNEYINYVDFLFKKGIISGDTNGNFNPKKSITRAEFTKLIVESIKLLKEDKTVVEDVKRVSVATKLDSLNKIIFYDVKDNTETYEEIIDGDVEIFVGGKEATYDDILIDMLANITYANNKLIKIEADEIKYETVVKDGPVTDVLPGSNVFYYRDMISDKLNYVEVPSTVPILKNGAPVSLKDIQEGEHAFVSYKKESLIEVNFKSKTEKFEGVIDGLEIGEDAVLKLKVGENVTEFKFVAEPTIKRNFDIATISDLKVGDMVVIETEYGKVSSLDATADMDTISGRVEKLSKGNVDALTVSREGKDSITFEIPKGTEVTLDGSTAKLFDLKIGNYVSVKLDGEKVMSVRAETDMPAKGYVGLVTKLYDDVDVFILETNQENFSVSTDEDVLFINEVGNKVTFKDLKKGQKVFVYGVKEDVYLNASKVFILE